MKLCTVGYAAGLLVLGAVAGQAQVGTTPERSPYEDFAQRHEVVLRGGWYAAEKDEGGVAPRSAPFVGVQYSWRVSGPAMLSAEVGYIKSERMMIDPRKSAATRELGVESWPLGTIDLGLDVGLTGDRVWHRLMPVAHAGLGFVSDFKVNPDTGGFRFGTRFAFNLGAGMRWLPGGHWAARADANVRTYSIGYPEVYFTPPNATDSPVIAFHGSRRDWTFNPTLTLGVAYVFGH